MKYAPWMLAGLFLLFCGGAWMMGGRMMWNRPTPINTTATGDGQQRIDITVRGGYEPSNIVAKAGVPTVLRMRTRGTYDCSSALVIPALNVQQLLPADGETDIVIPAEKAIGTLQGMCSMGMYRFAIRFE
jgi:Cu+-exporting ATPase